MRQISSTDGALGGDQIGIGRKPTVDLLSRLDPLAAQIGDGCIQRLYAFLVSLSR